MRLFLLPISTRQSLLYCQRLNLQLSTRPPSLFDKLTNKATTTWVGWEKKGSGWQKQVTTYGNTLFQRLPHEEYGLKSIPPLSERRKSEEIEGKEEVLVEFPEGLIEEEKAREVLKRLGGPERQAFHQKWLIGSLIGMPISAPIALLPVVPNLPFFYLCFRAWSHWRALSGSRHLQFLLDKQLIKLSPSTTLKFAYAEASMDEKTKQIQEEVKDVRENDHKLARNSKHNLENQRIPSKSIRVDSRTDISAYQPKEEMLLSASSGTVISEMLEIPEIKVEIDRAVWQVERAIKGQDEKKEDDITTVKDSAGQEPQQRR